MLVLLTYLIVSYDVTVEITSIRSVTGRTFGVADTDGAELHAIPLPTNTFLGALFKVVTGPDGR